MGVHRKETQEVVRLWGLYIILTKDKRFGPGEINYEKVTWKYGGETPMEDKGYFSKGCLCRLMSMLTLHLWS